MSYDWRFERSSALRLAHELGFTVQPIGGGWKHVVFDDGVERKLQGWGSVRKLFERIKFARETCTPTWAARSEAALKSR